MLICDNCFIGAEFPFTVLGNPYLNPFLPTLNNPGNTPFVAESLSLVSKEVASEWTRVSSSDRKGWFIVSTQIFLTPTLFTLNQSSRSFSCLHYPVMLSFLFKMYHLKLDKKEFFTSEVGRSSPEDNPEKSYNLKQ